MSAPAIAQCTWRTRAGIGHDWDAPEPEDTTYCRASIGERIVTVWLPKGAKIRLRHPRMGRFPDGVCQMNFRHTYGRDRDNRIEIRIVPAPAIFPQ